jgi:hypothetical protein
VLSASSPGDLASGGHSAADRSLRTPAVRGASSALTVDLSGGSRAHRDEFVSVSRSHWQNKGGDMGNVVIDMSMSLDGYIAAPNDNPEQGLGEDGDEAP